MAETLKVARPRDASLPANPEYGPPTKKKKKLNIRDIVFPWVC